MPSIHEDAHWGLTCASSICCCSAVAFRVYLLRRPAGPSESEWTPHRQVRFLCLPLHSPCYSSLKAMRRGNQTPPHFIGPHGQHSMAGIFDSMTHGTDVKGMGMRAPTKTVMCCYQPVPVKVRFLGAYGQVLLTSRYLQQDFVVDSLKSKARLANYCVLETGTPSVLYYPFDSTHICGLRIGCSFVMQERLPWLPRTTSSYVLTAAGPVVDSDLILVFTVCLDLPCVHR